MFCDNCGAKVDDNAAFCPKCGQQLVPEKASIDAPPPTRIPHLSRKREEDFLCFGENRGENPWIGGLVLICIGIFLVIIFYVPAFPVELLVVLGFFLFGAIAIIQGLRKGS